jgi:hypothetical protein
LGHSWPLHRLKKFGYGENVPQAGKSAAARVFDFSGWLNGNNRKLFGRPALLELA